MNVLELVQHEGKWIGYDGLWNEADLFPGTGAVTRAWQTWRGLFVLPAREDLKG